MVFDRFEVLVEEFEGPQGVIKTEKLFAYSSQRWFDYFYRDTVEDSDKSETRFECTLRIIE